MMGVVFRKPGPKLTEEDLSPDRNRLGLPLPPAYVRWLLTTNGGDPKPKSFRTRDSRPSNRISVEAFGQFPRADQPIRDSLLVTHGYLVSELGMPRYLLPIAHTTDEGFLLLDIRGESGGQVYYWDLLAERFEYDERDGRVIAVADSVAHLLEAYGVGG